MFNTNSFSRNLVGSVAALLLGATFVGAATAPANAATVEANSVRVSYSDLNLSSEAGRSVLAARVKTAAKTVCASDFDDIASRTAEQNCINDAIANTKLTATTKA